MSKYNKEKVFFTQTPIKFWYRQDIIWLQNQPDGYEILIFYNKLMGMTANMDGFLLKQFGDIKEPYTNEEIAKITMHDLSMVEKGIEILEKMGLLEKMGNTYFIEEALNMTNQTVGAKEKQMQRKNKEDKCPPECPPDCPPNCPPYTNIQSNTKQETNINKNKEKEIDNNITTNIQLNNKYNNSIKEIINYLNIKSRKRFTTKNEFVNNWIIELLDNGYTIDDFKKVIDNKTEEWGNDPDKRKYLRPGTLFNPSNFSKFLSGNNLEKESFDDAIEDYLNGEEPDNRISF